MGYTIMLGKRDQASDKKKKGFFAVTGIKAGHYIQIVLSCNEGDDGDGETCPIIKVSSVRKDGDGIAIDTDDICADDSLFLSPGLFYRRYSKKEMEGYSKSYGRGYLPKK